MGNDVRNWRALRKARISEWVEDEGYSGVACKMSALFDIERRNADPAWSGVKLPSVKSESLGSGGSGWAVRVWDAEVLEFGRRTKGGGGVEKVSGMAGRRLVQWAGKRS